tara:strand:+ start:935 stop:1159 length:225 start_codon:yes stop_codon:yes gene_type:complete
LKKQERAEKVTIGTILTILPKNRWYFDNEEYEVLGIDSTNPDGHHPLFQIEERGEKKTMTYRWFSIPNISKRSK